MGGSRSRALLPKPSALGITHEKDRFPFKIARIGGKIGLKLSTGAAKTEIDVPQNDSGAIQKDFWGYQAFFRP
jgi:hypothetical protein